MGLHDWEMDCLTEAYNHVNLSRDPSPNRDGYRSPRHHSPVMAGDEGNCDIPVPIQYIGCQDLLELKCTHCGWLRKRRTLSLFSWPQAYIVLHDGSLYYFKNERSRAAAGKFSLYGYNAVFRASEILPKEAPWCFKIVHSHKEFKTYYFSASSEQEMKVWMSKIKLEMLHANGKSALYGKNLPHVKEEKPDKTLDDPSFYQNIEENIYDDSTKFVPEKDYQKKCSIKRMNEDSEDEEIETNPAIDERPPQPLPKGKEPFMISSDLNSCILEQPPLSPPVKPPSKPPRIVGTPPPSTPPRVHRAIPPPADSQNQTELNSKKVTDVSCLNNIQKMALKIDEQMVKKTPLVPPAKSPKARNKRRPNSEEILHDSKEYALVASPKGKTGIGGSYEKTDGPGNKSPTVGRRGFFRIVPDGSGGGSTGSDDPQSDIEEDWSDIYFQQDKQKANEILQTIGEDGVYLVRPENNGTGKVLVVFVKDHCRKYRIMTEEGEHFIHREDYRDKSVENLMKHYYHNNLPTMSLKLKMPYKLHPVYKAMFA
ncbi:SH3 domain-binding protein 2-like isoform X2 [Mercenaria mercenaria]|uniref:SH3 domain-binding protein 2-like isoform X2 n=1 Tax=Mercenaria mercenaria TaxID=6596 RepID=UPI00234F5AA9|nr:SH3 domain-binding protein 2-like isoform X2 [Mercenaria mercenaria]